MAKTNYSIINLSLFNDELKYGLDESVEHYGKFTHVPSDGAKKIKPRSIVFLINMEGELAYVGRLKRSASRVATAQRRLRGDNFFELRRIPINQLPDELHRLISHYTQRSTSHLSNSTGEKLRAYLESESPELINKFSELESLIDHSRIYVGDEKELILEQQKDAVVLAVKSAGFMDDVTNTASTKIEMTTQSFLESLNTEKIGEDRIVDHDSRVFSDWTEEEIDTISSAVEFRQGDKTITIFSANRRPLEEVFGVDLIYVDAPRKSATFVQYKLMDQEDANKNAYFNPNKGNHNKELQRMRNLSNYLQRHSKNSGKLNDIRTDSSPLFFKLCTARNLKKDENNVAIGLYFPLNHWEIVLQCPETLGPKGGRQIGFHTVGDRYFTTTQFIELLKKNMIGTRSDVWTQLSDWIRQSVNANRSVVVAIRDEIATT